MRIARKLIACCAAMLLAVALVPLHAFADPAIDDAKALIAALDDNPANYTEADRGQVNQATAAYEALSSADQHTLDITDAGPSRQPYGRVLESAQWSLNSLAVPDNSTTLPNGTYDSTTTPALSSSYSKGKSTSPRVKPWSVARVVVEDGHAFADIAVESDSYPSMTTGGATYANQSAAGQFCTFTRVPIDLNTTFYFYGTSSSMPRPISFSLTTSIDESAQPTPTYDIDDVKALIEVLPLDPISVTSGDAAAVQVAQSAYDTLSAADKAQLDTDQYKSVTYGRILEQASWALSANSAVDNSTSLADGTYTGKVACDTNLGKSSSIRQTKFSVLKVTVTGGKATALLEYGGSSADYIVVGGKKYYHVNKDESAKSQFEVPIDLNSTMRLISMAKNPGPTTVGITYEITTAIDEAAAKPDSVQPAGGGGTSTPAAGGSGAEGNGAGAGSGAQVRSSARGVNGSAAAAVAKAKDGKQDPKADEAKVQSGSTESRNASAIDGVPYAEADGSGSGSIPTPLVAAFPALCLVLGGGGFVLWYRYRDKHFKIPQWVCG